MRYIPRDLVNIILEYDGRIKYRNGEYVDIIHKHDDRYKMMEPIINKKKEIIKTIQTDDLGGFYFDLIFNTLYGVGLCYDYNFSYMDTFEICYYDFRNGLEQIRTYL
jgi:hypothetical protein